MGVSSLQAGKLVQQVMKHVEAHKIPGYDVVSVDNIPAAYNGLVRLAAGNRRIIGTKALEKILGEAKDLLCKPPPNPLLNRLGFGQNPTAQIRALADELSALLQLESGPRYAAMVQLGARGGS